jgi:Zn-dependent protease with chaperone function
MHTAYRRRVSLHFPTYVPHKGEVINQNIVLITFQRLFKSVLSFLVAIAFSTTLNAQLQPVFKFQQDDTLIKKKYFEKAAQANKMAISSLTKENRDDYNKIYKSRFTEIEKLLTSPRSVTAAGAHQYLQSLVQKITSANPELASLDLRVVFTRDWWPNAYSMGEGTIAINAGLLVFLADEAELVFVLCHELSHLHLDHSGKSIRKYVETVNSEEFQKELKRLSKQQYGVNTELEKLTKNLVFDGRKHSRNNEAESDRQAFKFMKKTGYNCNSILSALQLLDKIDDSSLFRPLNVEQAFNFQDYPFRKQWIKKESSIFSQVDEAESLGLTTKEKDSLKTHPDCSKRIALLQDSVNALGNTGKSFLVNEELFKRLKKDFVAEITEYCYTGQNLSRNLYYNLVSLQAGENVPMSVFSIARCLNDLYDKQKDHKLGLAVDTENKNYPEDYNQLLRMLAKLRLEEIAALNYNFCKQRQEEMKNFAGFAEQMKRSIAHQQ